MSYSAYQEFSPPRWPGTQPAPVGWEVRRLKFAVTCNDEALSEDTDPDYEMAYVDISGVDLVEGITTIATLPFEEAPSRARRIVRHGDTIISTVRTYLKAIAAIEEPPSNMIVSTGFAVVRPLDFIDSGFLGYALQSSDFINAVVANSTGVSYPAINPSTLVCLPFGYPEDRNEQQQIAAFLDWKTEQIDALIKKKKELLGKLKEKRIAVITQAVTQGLNPAAPLRDSGIPWLGQVPQHWKVKRLRYCTGLVTSGSRGWAQHFADTGDLFLRITNLDRDSIELLLEDIQRVEPPDGAEGARTLTKPGDLLISITADLGSVAVIPSTLEPAYVSQHLSLVRLDTIAIDPHWIAYSIFSYAGKFQLRMAGYGGTKIQLSLDDIKEITFCHPPDLEEQQEILEFIRAQTKRTEALLGLASQAIDRLTEYRSAFIAAATTGKIDVRRVKIPQPAA